MDGWKEGERQRVCKGGWRGRWMDGWMSVWGWLLDRQVCGEVGTQADGQMGGWMDGSRMCSGGWIDRCMEG